MKGLRPVSALVAGLSLVGSLVLFSAPASEAAGETVTLEPQSGPPGTKVTITATNFGKPCEFIWSSNQQVLGTCEPDAGTVVTNFIVPNVEPGDYGVLWCSGCGLNQYTGFVKFTVTDPPTTTAPPPTTTTAPPATTTTTATAATTTTVAGGSGTTTTTRAATTTTSSPTTTTTTTIPGDTTNTPFAGPLPAPLPGSGIADFSGTSLLGDLSDLFTPFDFEGGVMRFPDMWLLRCGGPPESTRVDFDDQELGSTGVFGPADDAERTTTSQPWSVVAPSQGTVTAPHAISRTVQPSPNTGHDPAAPVFRSPRPFTYFGLHVGLAEDVGETVVVELAARVFPANWADIDRVELGPGRSPATTCLMVVAQEGRTFLDAHLRVYSESGAPVPVIIDSVYWSHDRPYPVEPDIEPVEMEILWPTPTVRLPTALTTPVWGRISWPAGFPLNRVEIASPSWDGSSVEIRNASVGRVTVDGLEASASFWVNAIPVPSGPFEVRATAIGPRLRGSAAVTLEGLGLPTAPTTDYRSLVEGEVDVIPWAMEVTQAIRGPLVVQGPGSIIDDDFFHVMNKRTVVRGYATHQLNAALGIRPGQLMLDAVLHGTRNGVTLPWSPLTPMASPTRVFGFDPGPPSEGASRPFAANTFNFVLPYEWTAAGDAIQLRLEVNPVGSPNHIEEITGRAGWANTISQRVEFLDVGRVGVGVVNVEFHWRCTEDMVASDRTGHPCIGMAVGDPVSTVRTTDEIRTALPGWWKTIPAPGDFPAYLNFSEVDLPHMNDDPQVSVDRTVVGRASALEWTSLRDAYWDLYCTDGGPDHIIQPATVRDFIWLTQPPWAPLRGGGCGKVNRRSAFRANTFWGTPAQEAGHTLGMEHSGTAHGEMDGGGAAIRFPGDHGQIDLPGQSTWGFDTALSTVVGPTSGGHVHDYMSYGGGGTWTSVGTWSHVLRSLFQNRTYPESRGPVYEAEGGSEAAAGVPGEGEALIVEGTVGPDGDLNVKPPYLGDAGAFLISEGDDLEVSLETVDGETLTRTTGFTFLDSHHGSGYRSFVVVFPSDVTANAMRVDADGFDELLLETTGSGLGIEILEVTPALLRWKSGDAEPPFIVEVSNDDGESWWRLGTTEEPTLGLGSGVAPMAGDGWVVRVQGADGPVVHFDTAPVDFGDSAPRASIGLPVDGARLPVGVIHAYAAVSVIGDVDARYRWSVGGVVMNEGEVADLPIMPGDNTITLTVENSAGTDEHTINVIGVFDSDGDGLDDEWEERYGRDPLTRDVVEDDSDEDGLNLAQEYQMQTDPDNPDTDGDGDTDGLELIGAGDPLDPMLVAGPVHGAGDAGFAVARDERPPSVPVWILVAGAVGLVAPLGYWLGRRRLGRRV